MKTPNFKTKWIILLLTPFLLGSCVKDMLPGITGHGEIVSERLSLDDFTGFGNTIAADIYVRQGDEQEVVIEAQQNIIDNLELDEVFNNFWTIKYYRWVRNAKPVKIFITIPTLDRVVISGSGEVVGETEFVNLNALELKISGSGNMFLDTQSDQIDLVISGSGDVELEGSTTDIHTTISGSGTLQAFDLDSNEAEIKISGSGDARLQVSDYLKATISGSGSIIYRGTPETEVRISGSGEVIRDR